MPVFLTSLNIASECSPGNSMSPWWRCWSPGWTMSIQCFLMKVLQSCLEGQCVPNKAWASLVPELYTCNSGPWVFRILLQVSGKAFAFLTYMFPLLLSPIPFLTSSADIIDAQCCCVLLTFKRVKDTWRIAKEKRLYAWDLCAVHRPPSWLGLSLECFFVQKMTWLVK